MIRHGLLAVLALVALTSTSHADGGPGKFTVHETPRPLPELRFVGEGGRQLTLTDFRGKALLVNVWATWCVPCREEMPTLDRLQARLGGPELEVIALSIDRAGMDVVKEFYAEIGVRNLGRYVDASGEASRALRIVGLPTTLLVDAKGRELGRLVGATDWNSPAMVAFIRNHMPSASTGGTREGPPS